MNTTFDRHAKCLASLPAFLDGTLPPRDATAVLAHTGQCADCHAELEIARRVRAHFAREWRSVAPLLDETREQDSFDQLWARITAESPAAGSTAAEPRVVQLLRPKRRQWASRLMPLAATVVIGAGYVWNLVAGAPLYRTLADPTRSCVALRVQLSAQTPATDARKLIEATGAHIVDGPDAQGVYMLRAPNAAESLRQLHALPSVQLAEPADC